MTMTNCHCHTDAGTVTEGLTLGMAEPFMIMSPGGRCRESEEFAVERVVDTRGGGGYT